MKALVRPKGKNDLAEVFDSQGHVISMIETPYELGILHTFHFTSKLKRMGVITKNLKEDSIDFYMKGAPEVLLEKCSQETIPKSMNKILGNYTCSGYRVLACASKVLDNFKYSDIKSSKLEDLEKDLKFLGLIVMQNKLKPQTTPVIKSLQKAGIKTIMATGDAVLTGISVARECHMINSDVKVYLGEMHENNLMWQVFKSTFKEGDDAEEQKPKQEPP